MIMNKDKVSNKLYTSNKYRIFGWNVKSKSENSSGLIE